MLVIRSENGTSNGKFVLFEILCIVILFQSGSLGRREGRGAEPETLYYWNSCDVKETAWDGK